MTRYQLPTGKTVLLPIEDILDMTDERLQELIANDAGMEIENIFSDFNASKPDKDIPDIEVEDIPEEIKKEIEKDFET